MSERLQKHLKLQIAIFSTIAIGKGVLDFVCLTIENKRITAGSIDSLITVLLYIYLPLAIIFLILYLMFVNGTSFFLKLYYSGWLELANRFGDRKNKIFTYLFEFFFDEIYYALILKSKSRALDNGNYTDFVFNRSWDQKPVFIRREHLINKRYWPNWAFSTVVLLNNKIRLVRKDNSKFVLEVDLQDESYGIYNNAGKAFISSKFLTDVSKEQFKSKSKRIEDFFLKETSNTELEIKTNKYPIRWASGGVLPIAKWKGKDWFVLFFRGISPVGWGIANGASESKDEYKNLNSLMLREFFEEMLIADREPTVGDERPLKLKVFDPSDGILSELPPSYKKRLQSLDFIKHHLLLRRKHDNLNVIIDKGNPIPISRLETPFELNIKYHDKQSRKRIQSIKNLLFTFDLFQFGIECVSIYRFEMDNDDYPLFGEIWDVANCLLREPVMFLSCDYVLNQYRTNNQSLGEHIYGDNSYDSKVIPNLDENDFVLFDRDIDFRMNRVSYIEETAKNRKLNKNEISELALHKKWNEFYRAPFLQVRDEKKSINKNDHQILRTLCPFTWKLLEIACRYNVIT